MIDFLSVDAARRSVAYRILAERQAGDELSQVLHDHPEIENASDFSCCVRAMCKAAEYPEDQIAEFIDAVFSPDFRLAVRKHATGTGTPPVQTTAAPAEDAAARVLAVEPEQVLLRDDAEDAGQPAVQPEHV